MVKERMDLLGLLRERGSDGDVDFLREALSLHRLPCGSLEAGVVQQSPGAPEQGDTAPDRCSGYLSQPAEVTSIGV